MSKERSTPLRRTCPICGRKARDLGRTRDIPMCMACRLALLKAETVLWGLASYVEWAAARARRYERASWRESQRLMNLVEDLCERPAVDR